MRLNSVLPVACWAAAVLVLFVSGALAFDVVARGMPLISWEFLTTTSLDAGRAGGIGGILVSTFLVVGIALLVALPLSTATAIFLSEYTTRETRMARLTSGSLDTLAAVPSVVYGLFGNALFCKALGLGFSVLSGGLTLACMVLPLTVRLTEAGLRAVPDDFRQAGAALGLSRHSLLRRVLLPAAFPGLAAGFVLGLGRALSETAALLFTSGYVDRIPESLFDSGRVLSVHIYDLAMNVPGGSAPAYASTLTLLVLLLTINGTALWVSRRWRDRLLA